MEMRTRSADDVLVVDMVGRLDSRTSGPVSTELNALVQGGRRKLVLNLAGVDYMSSAGLRAILVAAKLMQVHDGALKICAANPSVQHVMEVSGIGSLLNLCASEQEALAALA